MSASKCLASSKVFCSSARSLPDGLAHLADGTVHVLDSFIGVLAKRIQLIGKAVNFGPLRRKHCVDVIEYVSYLPLIGLSRHVIQICEQCAGVSADFFQFASRPR